jgi:hypothetical protein
MSAPMLLNNTGCPPVCGVPVVRVLTAGLAFADIPEDHSYLALDNIRQWVLAYDMTTIPWSRNWFATFSSDGETEPDTQGLGSTGTGLPNSTYLTDSAVPTGSCIFGFQRVQVLFQYPCPYLLLCVGWENGFYGYYDEGCAGIAKMGGCGVMEIPWSVIPGYPYVWLFLQGTHSGDNEVWPDLITLVDNVYGAPSLAAGPDWNQNQTCLPPAHVNDPFGGQFVAP